MGGCGAVCDRGRDGGPRQAGGAEDGAGWRVRGREAAPGRQVGPGRSRDLGDDRNPASFWNCGRRLGARAGRDSAYWRPDSAALSRPLAARPPGVSQQRPRPREHSELCSPGDVTVPLATADGNAAPPGRVSGAGPGRAPGGARLKPRPLPAWGRGLTQRPLLRSVHGAALGARCPVPPACSPPIHPLVSAPPSRWLPPAIKTAPGSVRSPGQRCLLDPPKLQELPAHSCGLTFTVSGPSKMTASSLFRPKLREVRDTFCLVISVLSALNWNLA